MNKNLKNILLYTLLIFVLLIVSLIMGSILSFLLSNPEKTKLTLSLIFSNMFNEKSIKFSIVIFIAIIIVVVYSIFKLGHFSHTKMLNREDRAKSGLHGNARWQTNEEMIKNFGEQEKKKSYRPYSWDDLHKSSFEGVICNSFKKNKKLYIEGCSNIHSLVIGGTGSGKTTGLISPTIQANALSKNKPSMLIYDLKSELYKQHSKLLEEQGYNVLILNLKEPVKSIKFNPLSIIWELYQDFQVAIENDDIEAQTDLETKISNYITDIALKIVPTASGENKVWSEGSQGIIKGLLWGMLEDSKNPAYNMTKEKFTLSQIGNILNIPTQREEMFNFLQNRPKDSIVFKKSGIILNNESEKTVASYISNTQTNLEKFTEVGIEIVTSASDFEMEDLIKQQTAIFVAIDDTNSACHILCSLLTSQVRNYLVHYADTHGGALDRTWYFFLDEFANLPKIENFNKWMSTDRSRKLFYCIILQSLSQLKNIFNEEEKTEIINNCSLQMFLNSSELQSLKYFQDLFGTYTEYSRSANINEKSLEAGVYEGSKGLTERHLVNLDDLQYIKRGNIYFYYVGLPPCKATLIPFYDPELKENGSFKTGSIKIDRINKRPEWRKCFYDLEQRQGTYLNEGNPVEEAIYENIETIEPQLKPNKKIEDVTEEYEVDTKNINTLNYDTLSKLMNWNQEEQEENEIEELVEEPSLDGNITEQSIDSTVQTVYPKDDLDFLSIMKKYKVKKRKGDEDEE